VSADCRKRLVICGTHILPLPFWYELLELDIEVRQFFTASFQDFAHFYLVLLEGLELLFLDRNIIEAFL